MTDPRGFLELRRRVAPYRPVGARRSDWGYVGEPAEPSLVREQARRCMDCGVPFCHTGCPLGNLIPDWNDLVERDRWAPAGERLHATNNFPEFTGALCPAPCEEACVVALGDEAVTIKQVELAIAERAWDDGGVLPRPPARETGRRVAIVGSGPAGLAAAQQLRRAGHAVVVLERDEAPGGLLRFGIPDFKLDKALVDRRVAQIVVEGVEIRTGENVANVATLRASFDAVVLATGAQRHRDLALAGRDLAGIELAMPYLVARNRGERSAPGARVAIIGGGDTSADCLGTAIREGAAAVVEIAHGPTPPTHRQPQRTWPEWPSLLRTYAAHLEGGEREHALEPLAFLGDADGHVKAIHARRLSFPGYDGVGPRPLAARGEEVEIACERVLIAVGFMGVEQDAVYDGVTLTARSTVAVDADRATSLPGVFAAGDCVRGADLVVTAIAEGRSVAAAVSAFLAAVPADA